MLTKNPNLRHINPGVLDVYIYHGAQKEIEPEALARYDIVITTYSAIRMEFFPPRGNSQRRKSPIKEIKWFRVVLDEGRISSSRVKQS